jgi:hypothetical protein
MEVRSADCSDAIPSMSSLTHPCHCDSVRFPSSETHQQAGYQKPTGFGIMFLLMPVLVHDYPSRQLSADFGPEGGRKSGKTGLQLFFIR